MLSNKASVFLTTSLTLRSQILSFGIPATRLSVKYDTKDVVVFISHSLDVHAFIG